MASTAFFFYLRFTPTRRFRWKSGRSRGAQTIARLPGWTAPGIMVSVRADEEVSAGSAEGRETAYPCATGWFNNRGGQTHAAQNPPAQQGTPAWIIREVNHEHE